jgi:hypothetical protein
MVTSTTRWVGGHTYYVRSKTLCLLYLEGGANFVAGLGVLVGTL